MPMDFPDMHSLKNCAKVHGFRRPKEDESESDYRSALADHVRPRDLIESMEIRNKVGWDRFTQEQEHDVLKRSGILDKLSLKPPKNFPLRY